LAINIIKIINWRRGLAAGVSWLRVDTAVPHARAVSLAGGCARLLGVTRGRAGGGLRHGAGAGL